MSHKWFAWTLLFPCRCVFHCSALGTVAGSVSLKGVSLLLVVSPSVISHLGSCPVGLTSSRLLCPPHLHPHLSLFLVPALHGGDGRSNVPDVTWGAIGQPRWNSYYLDLQVIYFSCPRLKMAASDGDRPVWPAKHCPPQIPLFIHKLDPRWWVVRSGRFEWYTVRCVCACT